MVERFNLEDRDLLIRELEDRDLLIRLDERFDALERTLDNHRSDLTDLKELYVTKIEFAPVQRAVYAAIGFILTGFLGAVLALVLKVSP